MRVIHEHAGRRVQGEAEGLAAGMLLFADSGGFFSLCPDEPVTKYNGLFARERDGRLFKSVEHLSLAREPVAITVKGGTVERSYETAGDALSFKDGILRYEAHGSGELLLDLDMRFLDDEETHGRVYRVEQQGDALIVTYGKYADDSRSTLQYSRVLLVKGVPPDGFRRLDQWHERNYAYDSRRGERPSFWVYRPGLIAFTDGLALSIACAPAPEEALAAIADRRPAASDGSPLLTLEQATTLRALHSLVVRSADGSIGVLAGLPWFTRRWSRDELISAGALITAGELPLAKEILLRYYELLDGRAALDAFYPSGGLPAADSLGWLSHRTALLLQASPGIFSNEELADIHRKLVMTLDTLFRERQPDGLVSNAAGETWMDASSGGDGRAGCRIEIQAGVLAACRLCASLEKKSRRFYTSEWTKRERQLAALVRERFFDSASGRLADGIVDGAADWTARPNVFLAHRLYPGLLSSEEWVRVFDYALKRLWMPWGGLATIDREHPLFCSRYTGADDRSYHRGDAWYWVDALAALSLQRVDKERFWPWIGALKTACLNDLLFQGALGHCSELSSAAEQEWGGCFAQAWSAALLYELLAE